MDAIFSGGGHMPSFGDKLTSKEISAVADFVLRLKK
jgi:mono/diheme cytochrome c family protein